MVQFIPVIQCYLGKQSSRLNCGKDYMTIPQVEYRPKPTGSSRPGPWVVLDYNIRFKALKMSRFNIRIGSEEFTDLTNAGFKEKYDAAMFWLRLTE